MGQRMVEGEFQEGDAGKGQRDVQGTLCTSTADRTQGALARV